MIWIKTEAENMTVTRFYLEIIGKAFERLNQKVLYTSTINEISPNSGDTVVVSTAPSVCKLAICKLANRKNIKIIYWAQGAWPEESYMRHSSKARFLITSLIEKSALKRADFCFFVSESMRTHFEKKYKLNFSKYYIMPCSNETLHEESFKPHGKYNNNVFCYAGGTSVWQCFEQTIELYSKIENTLHGSKLVLLVKDRDYALNVLKKYDVKNYEIDYVSIEELPERLKNVKFGFILREESVVNKVATPTKTLTYIANGVIPIYSESLIGIHEILEKCNYKLEILTEDVVKEISEFANMCINNEDVLKEFRLVYEESYDKKQHIKKIANKLLEENFI